VEAAFPGGDALDAAHSHGAFEVEPIDKDEDSGGERDAVAARQRTVTSTTPRNR